MGCPRRGGGTDAIGPFSSGLSAGRCEGTSPSERLGLLRRNDSAVTLSSAKHERLV